MMWRALLILGLLSPQAALADATCMALLDRDASLGHENAICGTSLLQGGHTQTTCYWTYAYRAADAQTQFDTVQTQIETCLGPDTILPADIAVNHPDSFLLKRYEAQGVSASLSLKDKAGLNQTLVFLSLHKLR